jgi:hypothetical protein
MEIMDGDRRRTITRPARGQDSPAGRLIAWLQLLFSASSILARSQLPPSIELAHDPSRFFFFGRLLQRLLFRGTAGWRGGTSQGAPPSCSSSPSWSRGTCGDPTCHGRSRCCSGGPPPPSSCRRHAGRRRLAVSSRSVDGPEQPYASR